MALDSVSEKFGDKLIVLIRSIKTLIDESLPARQESDTCEISQEIEHKIIMTLEEIAKIAVALPILEERVLHEYLATRNVMRLQLPATAEKLSAITGKVQMMIEDRTEDNHAPIILRINEMNKFLLQAQQTLTLSARISITTLVIQRPLPRNDDGNARLERLILVEDNFTRKDSHSYTKKNESQCSQGTDYGFFDVSDEFDKSFVLYAGHNQAAQAMEIAQQ